MERVRVVVRLRPGAEGDRAVKVTADALEAVLNGRNGLIMAYGPTGTGKTHSMDHANICC